MKFIVTRWTMPEAVAFAVQRSTRPFGTFRFVGEETIVLVTERIFDQAVAEAFEGNRRITIFNVAQRTIVGTMDRGQTLFRKGTFDSVTIGHRTADSNVFVVLRTTIERRVGDTTFRDEFRRIRTAIQRRTDRLSSEMRGKRTGRKHVDQFHEQIDQRICTDAQFQRKFLGRRTTETLVEKRRRITIAESGIVTEIIGQNEGRRSRRNDERRFPIEKC